MNDWKRDGCMQCSHKPWTDVNACTESSPHFMSLVGKCKQSPLKDQKNYPDANCPTEHTSVIEWLRFQGTTAAHTN